MKRTLKRGVLMLLAGILLLLALAGCAYTAEDGVQKEEKALEGKVALEGKKVIFIGNSFTYYGKCVLDKDHIFEQSRRTGDEGYFYQICKANGIDVDVTNFTFGGHQLKDFYSCDCAANRGHDGRDHMMDLVDRNYDYVILQNGTASADLDNILDECQPLMDAFLEENPNTKFVFLVQHWVHSTSHAWRSSIKDLEDAGIIVVDWGALVNDVINGTTAVPGATETYEQNSFIISKSEDDGFHPNMLTGYITALMTYCAITGESAVGQDYSFCGDVKVNRKFDIADYIRDYYTYNPETNFNTILESEADMNGLQQLIDQYLEEKAYRNY